ncbi:MAG: site-specific DNA-methyltransferase [Candidatus Contendobacter sp.]|jgi:adenine-specific DNA-methyltransferase|nr:site-specific DNA-methyltransferase [Candidatus Contendobacter sp.]
MPELDFKGKEFVYNHHLAIPHRPLVPHTDKSIGESRLDGNLIIHGDNLHALKALLPMYAGRVDCIFIDPPYNTGNEGWCYNDNVNSPMLREWLKSNPVGIEDGLRHDKWLCMMWPRLRLLHELLSETGIIFVTLDDNEMPRFRSMMDEVFGDCCFIAQIIVQSNKRGQTYKQIAKTHEYLLCYGKTFNNELAELETEGVNLPEEDEYGKFSSRELRNRNPKFGRKNRPNLFFPIFAYPNLANEHGECPVSVVAAEGAVAVLPFNSEEGESCWRWGVSKVETNTIDQSTRVLFARTTREGHWRIHEKYRKETIKAKTIWNETKHISEQGTALLGELGLADRFQFPKPLGLLEDCLALATDEGALILDSFAGSGTTAHAVLSANAKDGGNRKFILVECEDYADTLTAERIRRIINGYAFSGTQRKELHRENITFTSLRKADKLLDHVESIRNLDGHRFDHIKAEVKDGALIVTGEKAITERVEGLGGSFTFCTLGDAIDMDQMLTGESLPAFEQLGMLLFHTATNEVAPNPLPTEFVAGCGYLGESTQFHVWLIYRPDLEFLKSREAALTLSRAEALVNAKPGKKHCVFAPAKFVSQKLLNEAHLPVEFAPLPFALYRIERG